MALTFTAANAFAQRCAVAPSSDMSIEFGSFLVASDTFTGSRGPSRASRADPVRPELAPVSTSKRTPCSNTPCSDPVQSGYEFGFYWNN